MVLHYHLFKNAGTSVDRALRDNYGARWVTAEFPPQKGDNSALVADWIAANPEACAFSTHTALGPPPAPADVEVLGLIFLRDPLERALSAYRFERGQQADTFGAQLAKSTDFSGYVRTHLDRPGDRQCHDFHTSRLSMMRPGPEPELERAIAALEAIDLVGLVEEFDISMGHIAARLDADMGPFSYRPVHLNPTSPDTQALEPVRDILEQANQRDRALIAHAKRMLSARRRAASNERSGPDQGS